MKELVNDIQVNISKMLMDVVAPLCAKMKERLDAETAAS